MTEIKECTYMNYLKLSLAVGLAALLAACRTTATTEPIVILPTQAPATPTVQPTVGISVPTVTPQPVNTSTPEPAAATPTLAPTGTPTAPPTPDPNEGVGDVIYSDKLDGTGGWLWTYEDDAAKFGVAPAEKQLNSIAKRNGTWRFTISNDVINVGNQQLRVTARPTVCAEQDQYALLFRGRVLDEAASLYSYYAFKLRCDGSARLEKLEGPDTVVIVNWVQSSAIQTGVNVENTLMVWANKDQMRFYVNDQFLFEAVDGSLAEGFYGFYLFDRTNGNMAVSWKNLEARAINLP